MANKFGIAKLMRNILALQQGIRTIECAQQTAQLERARMYYSLFVMGPQVSHRFLIGICHDRFPGSAR